MQLCQVRSRDVYMLPMSVVDAEYQFDRHKLTIYYSANRYALHPTACIVLYVCMYYFFPFNSSYPPS
jgi:hypothetical protein